MTSLTRVLLPLLLLVLAACAGTTATKDGGGSKNGAEVMKGVYTEVIRGLHRNPIQVKGQVEMIRVSPIGVLNPTTW